MRRGKFAAVLLLAVGCGEPETSPGPGSKGPSGASPGTGGAGTGAGPAADTLPACVDAESHSLGTPSQMRPSEFIEELKTFLLSGGHQGWCQDKGRVRDTGNFLKNKMYGTHPPVHIFYSPEVMKWLVGAGRAPSPTAA